MPKTYPDVTIKMSNAGGEIRNDGRVVRKWGPNAEDIAVAPISTKGLAKLNSPSAGNAFGNQQDQGIFQGEKERLKELEGGSLTDQDYIRIEDQFLKEQGFENKDHFIQGSHELVNKFPKKVQEWYYRQIGTGQPDVFDINDATSAIADAYDPAKVREDYMKEKKDIMETGYANSADRIKRLNEHEAKYREVNKKLNKLRKEWGI